MSDASFQSASSRPRVFPDFGFAAAQGAITRFFEARAVRRRKLKAYWETYDELSNLTARDPRNLDIGYMDILRLSREAYDSA